MSEPLTKTREKHLRHGNKHWREGDAEDVESCLATIDALRDELATAEKEATRLSNYETSYNNLQSVVTSQYRNIDALTGELAEARGHWRACEEGWNKVIKQAEDFQDERDDAYKLLESMTVARDGLSDRLLEVLQDSTDARERFTSTLEEYSDRVVELSDNNRLLRDGWTADNMKLMNVLGALPAIIFGVVYYDLGEHGITWKVCVERWERHWVPALRQEHSGDCTDECHSCARCQAEDVMRLVDIVRRGLDEDDHSKCTGRERHHDGVRGPDAEKSG